MSEPTVRIRPAAAGDLDAIAALERRCFAEEAFSRRQLDHLIRHANGFFFTACCGPHVAGYVSLLRRNGCTNLRIYSIAVDPRFRNRHIGSLLIERSIACARKEGLEYLSLEVRTDNLAALRLYSSHEFRRTALLPTYYGAGTDAWRMCRPTTDH